MTTTCASCSTENPADKKFCRECGSPLQLACAACGSGHDPGDKFCGNCGTALGGGAPTVATEVPVEAAPTAARVEGKRFVSVLFADIVSYSTFSETRDSEDIRDMLTTYFDRAREIIERFGGEVDKFIGDAVMGVWGATAVREDDAQRAVRAALELVEMVETLGAEIGIPELRLRAGVNSGSTSVGPGGNEKGLVVGDLVNVASRLQSIAEPGTVYVGEATKSVTSRAIDYESMGEQTVKGKAEPVTAWKAVRVSSMVSGTSEDHMRPPPFVGRERELRLLKDTLTAAIAEQRTRHVAIIGEAGIGKTRLAEELKKHIDGYAEDVYWHQGRSPSFGDGVTFWALGEMVRQRAGILEGEDTARSRTRLRTVVTEFVAAEDDREWIEPRLAGLLGLIEMPEGSRSELFAALRTFVQAIAERGPTVMIFEDLHWADAGMVEFIAELVERSTRSPILVVTLARPDILDRHPNWGSHHRSSMAVRLAPMPESDMEAMVGAYLPGLEDEVVTQIAGRAAGFPLYAVEIVRMLTGSGELAETGGVYSYEGDPAVMALPDSLQAVIGARIDRLDAGDQSLLQDASVLGQTFTLAALSSLRDEPAGELESRLNALIKLELLDLEDDPRSPERGQYGFVQSLIGEVVYNRLPRQEKRAKHLAAAAYYETLHDPELAGVISGHFMGAFDATPEGAERAALIDHAVRSLTDAADRAVELHSHAQAMALLDDAIEMAVDEEVRAELRLKASESADKHGEVDRGLGYVDAALQHFTGSGSLDGVRRAATEKSKLLNGYFRSPDARAAIEDVYSDIEAVDDPITVGVAAEAARSFSLTHSGDAAVAAIDRLLPAAARFGLTRLTLDALITKATALGFEGRGAEAFALLRGVAEEAELRGLLRENGRALNNLASLLGATDPVQALEVSERLRDLGRRLGDLGWMMRTAFGIAFSYIADGRYDDALASIAEFPDEELDSFHQATAEYQRRSIAHLRGPSSPAMVDEIIEVLGFYAEDTDPQLQAWYQSTVAQLKADLAMWDEAFELGMGVDTRVDLTGLYIAAEAAVWSRDLDKLGMVAAQLDQSPIPAGALGGYIEAATAALEGHAERASELFVTFIEEESRKQLGSYLAQFRATFAMLVGQDDPAAAQAARDADEWLLRTGTGTLRRVWAAGLPPDAQQTLAG